MSRLMSIPAEVAPTATPLDTEEALRFASLEAIVTGGLSTFREVGSALLEIRDRKLYRGQCRTFEGYLRERWDLSRSAGYELMTTAKIAADLEADPEPPAVLPTNPTQVRPLVALPEGDRREAWDAAVEAAAEEGQAKPAARHVRQAARKMSGIPDIPPPGPEPEAPFHDPDPEADAEREAIRAADGIVPPPEESDEDTFVRQCELSHKLQGRCLAIFEKDARSWYKAAEKYLRPMIREGYSKRIDGAWQYQCSRFLRLSGPEGWRLCIAEGCVEGFRRGEKCPNCRGRGYYAQ